MHYKTTSIQMPMPHNYTQCDGQVIVIKKISFININVRTDRDLGNYPVH
jgi:hypothetical protein